MKHPVVLGSLQSFIRRHLLRGACSIIFLVTSACVNRPPPSFGIDDQYADQRLSPAQVAEHNARISGAALPTNFVPPIPTYSGSGYGGDITIRPRAAGGYSVYNWDTGEDVTLSPRPGGGYNGYNWTTGDNYTIKPKGSGRWNAYNWSTGDDYDVRVRPGGSAEIYNWRNGQYIDVY